MSSTRPNFVELHNNFKKKTVPDDKKIQDFETAVFAYAGGRGDIDL